MGRKIVSTASREIHFCPSSAYDIVSMYSSRDGHMFSCSRPRDINDVASQTEVVKTLQSAISSGNVSDLLIAVCGRR